MTNTDKKIKIFIGGFIGGGLTLALAGYIFFKWLNGQNISGYDWITLALLASISLLNGQRELIG